MSNYDILIAVLLNFAIDFSLIPLIRLLPEMARILSFISVIATSFIATLVLFDRPETLILVFVVMSMFRIINVSRIAINRMNHRELYKKYSRSALWLSVLSFTPLVLSFANLNWLNVKLLIALSMIGAITIAVSTIYSSVKWRNKKPVKISAEKLPTVSVCIPARNETQDLPDCIESVLDSSYTKLEILVLDDCSHDKTPEIIKEYAHQGVRFINGNEPDDDWLAKNQAMNKMFDEAKGEILIFLGVDVRFSKHSVQQIVNQMLDGYEMLSVLPRRSFNSELSVFIQPLRYWWELCTPYFLKGRPPVLSTCWAIKSASLKKLGEFDSFRKSVQPEAHFAKRLSANYRFVLSNEQIGITSAKRARDQYDTAIRTRYPQAKRRIELVSLLLLTEILIFFTPVIGIIYGLAESNIAVLTLSLANMALLVLINTYISMLTVYRTWFLGLFSLPFLLFEDWFILIRSMLAYEFGTVMWKDRNICLPMYKVEKKLPEL